MTPGKKFREAVEQERPLQVIGVMNAFVALMAARMGYRAIYLSGAGVANATRGFPDLAMTTLNDVAEEARRLTAAVSLPLMVDIDTGWGHALMIGRSIKTMIQAGVAAVHLEDQVTAKRCGHLPGKAVVAKEEMVDRIKAAIDAKTDPSFVVMARTDALAIEGLDKTIERAIAYKEAGADMLFVEAVTELEQYRRFKEATSLPLLANLTEFGKTPLFTKQELVGAGVDIALYPLSVARAMNKSALTVLEAIRRQGSQHEVIPLMQTREELYEFLNYHQLEEKLPSSRGGYRYE